MTDVLLETADALAVKFTLLRPVAMVIEFGTVTVALEDARAITVLDVAGLARLKMQLLVPGV